ncbi:MAG: methyltransferase domain-containing protein [archaeon]
MANYDIIGNIALVKFPREAKLKTKKSFALHLLKIHKQITTVLEKSNKISGRLRTPTTKHIAGIKTKEALYKENNCIFRLNIDTCYFSPRLSSERKELAKKIKPYENVLVMFGGVAPLPIVISKLSKAKKITSIELSRACTKYSKDNTKRNKLSNIEIIQGDVKKVMPKLKEKFDRIISARPNLKDSFLQETFKKIKPKGTIHYYGFYKEEDKQELKQLIQDEAKKAKKKIKILKIKKAGEIGVRKYRYRVDIKLLN